MSEDEDEERFPICPHCKTQTGHRFGHRWRFCKVTRTHRAYHYCCPTGCEIEEALAAEEKRVNKRKKGTKQL